MKRNHLLLAILLVAATAAAYLPAYHGEFIWDDDRHVSHNPLLQKANGLSAIWFSVGATPQYYPLTHTSFWIEWQFWQDSVLGYHITNVALHALASLLVVALFRRLEIPGAWLAGFIFALHPVHVESVAWISERKNTLSIVFALGALIAWPTYEASAVDRKRCWWSWALSFSLYVCAVLSKTVTCTLPAVVLVLIWWKRGRITGRDIGVLMPYLAVTAFAAMITGDMERSVVGAEGEDWATSPLERVLIAGRAVWWYVLTFLLPVDLAFSYTRWTPSTRDLIGWAAVAGVVLALGLAWALRTRLGRGPLAALLIFSGTLFPALGFINLFPHRYSFVADHFQYHSDIALIALIVAAAVWIAKHSRRGSIVFASLLVAVLAIGTYRQARIYQDHETLWRDTIRKTPSSWLAHNNLGVTLTYHSPDPTRLEEALRAFEKVRELRPQHERVDWSMGDLLSRLGRPDEAAVAYERAESLYRAQIQNNPMTVNPYVRLGDFYEQRGRADEALAVYMAGSASRPDISAFAERSAMGLAGRKRFAEAIPYLQRWAELKPAAVLPRVHLASAYFNVGQIMDARRTLLEGSRITPDDPGIRAGLDRVQYELTRPPSTGPSTAPSMAPASAAATRPA